MISRIARSFGDQVARCARRLDCAATAENYNIGVFLGSPDRRIAASRKVGINREIQGPMNAPFGGKLGIARRSR